MTYQELLDIGKKIFMFHPDEPFTSVAELLGTARGAIKMRQHYDHAAVLYAEHLARFADEKAED